MDIRNLMCTHYWILGYPDMDEDEKKSKNRFLGKFSVALEKQKFVGTFKHCYSRKDGNFLKGETRRKCKIL